MKGFSNRRIQREEGSRGRRGRIWKVIFPPDPISEDDDADLRAAEADTSLVGINLEGLMLGRVEQDNSEAKVGRPGAKPCGYLAPNRNTHDRCHQCRQASVFEKRRRD